MKVLVDECVPLKLVRLLTGHTLGSVMNLARSFSVRVMRRRFNGRARGCRVLENSTANRHRVEICLSPPPEMRR